MTYSNLCFTRNSGTRRDPALLVDVHSRDDEPDYQRDLSDHLPTLCNSMRAACLEHQMSQICGILTNYQDWIFVKYDLFEEIENKIGSPQFQVYGKIRMIDDNANHTLKKAELAKLLKIIPALCKLSK